MRVLVELTGSPLDITMALDATKASGIGVSEHGWWCTHAECGVFNGSLKEDLKDCRACARPRQGAKR